MDNDDFGPWIDHDGSRPDLDPMQWVEVQFSGRCDTGHINPFEYAGHVCELAWIHEGLSDDIVKYRVFKMTKAPERIMQFPHDYPEERIITWKDDDTGKFVGMCKYIRADLVPQWQPIETAPRDAHEVMVWSKSEGMCFLGRFVDGECRCPAWRPSDWSEMIYGVTHWMPLPAPPA